MKKLFRFNPKAYIRKNEIQEITIERESLEETLYYAITERGRLSKLQRYKALKNVVERLKKEGFKDLETKKEQLTESELIADELKSINLFGLG